MTPQELKQLKEWIKQLRWKSVDRDNMEFEVKTSCYVKDALEKFADTKYTDE